MIGQLPVRLAQRLDLRVGSATDAVLLESALCILQGELMS